MPVEYEKIDRSEYYWFDKLTGAQHKLIDYLEGTGGGIYTSTPERMTIRLFVNSGNNCGYINSTIHRNKDRIMGYRSPESDRDNGNNGFWDGCNRNQEKSAGNLFINRYSLKRGTRAYMIDKGTEKSYLIIKDLDLAMKVCQFSEML